MTEPAQDHIKSLEQRLARDPQSPLFARLAALYLQAGRPKEALRLCDDGLALYPFYSTAHLVKGKVLASLGMMAEAKHEFEVVREILPTNETVARLHSSIEPVAAPEPIVSPAPVEVAQPAAIAVPPSAAAVKEPVVEAAQPVAVEEVPPEETTPPESSFTPAEALPEQEPVTEEPPATQVEVARAPEESFGFGETAVVEPEPEAPSAADKLGLEMAEEPQVVGPDYGFDASTEAPAPAVEETPFGEQPIVEPQATTEASPEQPEEQVSTESAQSPLEPVSTETQTVEAGQNPDWFDAFSQLQQPEGASVEPAPAAAPEEENPFSMFETEQPTSPTVEGEAYEEYTARVRLELFGAEDTLTLDEYLGQSTAAEVPPESGDNIGDLAEKLKSSPRITPPVINFSEKARRVAGEGDTPNGSGIVTPTLAEIYVKQGWFDDAIKAYRVLGANKPSEKEKYEQRIAEIEEMKKKA